MVLAVQHDLARGQAPCGVSGECPSTGGLLLLPPNRRRPRRRSGKPVRAAAGRNRAAALEPWSASWSRPAARLAARPAGSLRLEAERLAAALRLLDGGGRIVVLPLARLEGRLP